MTRLKCDISQRQQGTSRHTHEIPGDVTFDTRHSTAAGDQPQRRHRKLRPAILHGERRRRYCVTLRIVRPRKALMPTERALRRTSSATGWPPPQTPPTFDHRRSQRRWSSAPRRPIGSLPHRPRRRSAPRRLSASSASREQRLVSAAGGVAARMGARRCLGRFQAWRWRAVLSAAVSAPRVQRRGSASSAPRRGVAARKPLCRQCEFSVAGPAPRQRRAAASATPLPLSQRGAGGGGSDANTAMSPATHPHWPTRKRVDPPAGRGDDDAAPPTTGVDQKESTADRLRHRHNPRSNPPNIQGGGDFRHVCAARPRVRSVRGVGL